jgi:hypothetical protein
MLIIAKICARRELPRKSAANTSDKQSMPHKHCVYVGSINYLGIIERSIQRDICALISAIWLFLVGIIDFLKGEEEERITTNYKARTTISYTSNQLRPFTFMLKGYSLLHPPIKESFKKSSHLGNLTKAFFEREPKTKNQRLG